MNHEPPPAVLFVGDVVENAAIQASAAFQLMATSLVE
jgi:hypothetical protein